MHNTLTRMCKIRWRNHAQIAIPTLTVRRALERDRGEPVGRESRTVNFNLESKESLCCPTVPPVSAMGVGWRGRCDEGASLRG